MSRGLPQTSSDPSGTTAIAGQLQAALEHHQAGRLLQAEELYQQILQINPGHPDALHLLGMLAQQTGHSDIAIELINHAIQASPENPLFHNSLGAAYQSGHLLDLAITSYQAAIKLKPDYADATYNLGTAYNALGNLNAAINHYQQALLQRPNFTEAHYNLGTALRAVGRYEEAAASFHKVLAIKPDHIDALNNLGAIFNEQGKQEEAELCFRKSISLRPNFAEGYNNLGIALKHQGKLDDAMASYQKAIALKPDYAEAYSNLGNALKDLGRFDEAIACCKQAMALKPNYAEACCNLGNIYKDQEHLDQAIACYRQALTLKPNHAKTYNNLGAALHAQGKPREAIAAYRKALEIDPDFSDAQTNLIFTLDLATDIDIPALQAERRHWAEAHALPLMASWRPHANSPEPGRRLRVGYVSADFRRHSAASVFATMLLNFDPARFEVFAYSNTLSEDQYTQLFRDHVSHWRKIVGLSDEAVADLVRADQIDILVDLSGHSGGNRLLAFARKPAPVQVTAWGYPTGTGMRAMDALFADAVVIPPEERQFYAESVRYLPSLVSFFSSSDFPAVAGLPAQASGAVTFGSFNRLDKVSPEAFALWARVLLAVPGSRMLLKSGEFDDPATCERVLGYFTSAGVAPERILMRGRTPWVEHVAAFAEVDIALDPFPHGGGVTALEGIMMGVPVVTLRWPTFAGRLSASILTTLALTDWIAESPEQYLDIAVRMAADIPALARLRANLRTTLANSPIGNTQAYARLVEYEYRALWSEWCSLQPPLH